MPVPPAAGAPARARRGLGAVPLVVALLALLLVPLAPEGAVAVPSQAELDEAEERAAELEELVGDAEAELAQVEERLEELQAELAAAQQELDQAAALFSAADRAATEAGDRAAATERARDAAVDEREDLQGTVSQLARDTYKYGAPSASPVLAILGSTGTVDDGRFADRVHYLQRGVGVRTVALERAGALTVEVEALNRRVNEERAAAQRALVVAEEARDRAATLHADVQDLTSEVSEQVDRSVQLVAALEDEQADVADRVEVLRERVEEEREQERLERERREREERERREREERERQEREAAERAARERAAQEQADQERAARERAEREQAEREQAERERQAANRSSSGSASGGSGSGGSGGSGSGSGGSGGGSGNGGSSGSGSSSSSTTAVRPGPSPNLVTVGGITVAASLGPQLAALLDAARADGIVLGGHGYRSPEITARLRIANGCPDVYDSPASSCRIPTARPGQSEHEKGLAVDFTWNGQTICYPRNAANCHGNAAFDWLRANAGRFGLINLPSEAWHWSTTGR